MMSLWKTNEFDEFVKDKYKLKHSARLFSLGYETTLEG